MDLLEEGRQLDIGFCQMKQARDRLFHGYCLVWHMP